MLFFAFERPKLGFSDFRRLSWQERFKQVIALPPASDMLRAYEGLVRIKNEFRNPLTHGLNNKSGLLMSVPFGGLVPVSFEHLNNSIHFGLTPILPVAVSEIRASCTGFLDLLNRTAPYAYYVRYLEYDFAVPMQASRVNAIKAKMTNLEEFERHLKWDQEYKYAILNREV